MTKLRLVRILKDVKQVRLAEETGIAQPMISDFELGKSIPNRDHLKRLARALKVPMHMIQGEIGAQSRFLHDLQDKFG